MRDALQGLCDLRRRGGTLFQNRNGIAANKSRRIGAGDLHQRVGEECRQRAPESGCEDRVRAYRALRVGGDDTRKQAIDIRAGDQPEGTRRGAADGGG